MSARTEQAADGWSDRHRTGERRAPGPRAGEASLLPAVLVDCGSCAVRGAACGGCVVTVLLGSWSQEPARAGRPDASWRPPIDPELIDPELIDPELIDPELTGAELTGAELTDPELLGAERGGPAFVGGELVPMEKKAIAVLADAGLVPRLLHRPV